MIFIESCVYLRVGCKLKEENVNTMSIRKYRKSILLLFFLCGSHLMKAEGQDGIANVFHFFDLLMKFSNGLIFTILIGFLIKIIMKKIFKNLNYLNIISFSIAFLIVLLLQICYQEKFTYLIFNNI